MTLLIVAGAGTGKTSTVMGKIAYLLKRKIINEDEVLALAYGRDAAQEMRNRLSELLNGCSNKHFSCLGT